MHYHFPNSAILGSPLKKRFTHIVGAGISGLLLGYYLKKSGVPFQIYESSDHTGGLLQTTSTPHGIVEHAANGFLSSPAITNLINDLSLTTIGAKKEARTRFFVRNKKLRRFPLDAFETLETISRAALPHSNMINSVEEFGRTFFGKTFTEYILDPALAGIYAGDISRLSFPGAMRSVAAMMNSHSSLLGAFTSKKRKVSSKQQRIRSFSGGLKVLVEELTNFLRGEILLNTSFKAQTTRDNVIITTPAYKAASFFPGHELEKILTGIEYLPLLSTTLFFERSALKNFREGFGCVFPRKENMKLLGVLFNSSIFEDRVTDNTLVSLTAIAGGAHNLNFHLQSDDEVRKIILDELDTLISIRADPLATHLTRHPWALPHYTCELYNLWFHINDLLVRDFPNMHLFGNYTGEISIRGLCETAARVII